MKSCCCSCPCTDECPCKSPCDCSKCIWKIKIKSKKDITTNEYLLDGLLRTFIILPFRNSAWISGSSCLNENLFLRFLSFLLCSFLLSVPREVVFIVKGDICCFYRIFYFTIKVCFMYWKCITALITRTLLIIIRRWPMRSSIDGYFLLLSNFTFFKLYLNTLKKPFSIRSWKSLSCVWIFSNGLVDTS